jgi:hypothetical protein
MAKIPIEDTFADIINKAQRGLQISDADLCAWANVSAEDLAAVKSGKPVIAVIRRVARHLRLAPTPSNPSRERSGIRLSRCFPAALPCLTPIAVT